MIEVGDLVVISNSFLKTYKRHAIVMEIRGKYHVKVAIAETGQTTIISQTSLTKLGGS